MQRFHAGAATAAPFLYSGIAPQLRSATPPSVEKPPERRDAVRPSLEHQNAAQPQTSQRRASPSAKTLHTSPRRYTAHQDAVRPTKMPRCSKCRNATRLRTSQRCASPKCQKLADVRCSVTKTCARWPHSCQNSRLLFPICHRALLRTANIGEFLPNRSPHGLRRTRYATVLTAG